MDKHFSLTAPIYGIDVEIFYNKNLKYIKKKVPEYIFAAVKDSKRTAQAAVFDTVDSNNIIVVFFKNCEGNKELDHGVIAHEMLHVTNRIMEKIGVEADNLNDEAYAYLLKFIIDVFYNTMDDDYDKEIIDDIIDSEVIDILGDETEETNINENASKEN